MEMRRTSGTGRLDARNPGVRDLTAQLAAWIAAEFTKRRYKEWDLGFPVFAVEIDGDNWLLRVAAARVVPSTSAATKSPRDGEGDAQETEAEEGPMSLPEDEYKLFFFGPLALGNTLTLESSKRLLANLVDITKWGQVRVLDVVGGECEDGFGEEDTALNR
ncbi:uncharacterized protein BDZ99DRAFT_544886 [Mytilinidion resinicola]|uniref:Uncharacterized protein n=1 Tax=Mytilinidion resinicola TaxID=574789 RepID=A0A6A6Y770_9PEZI|nr:uncharacterized protein BDZ99DRAFT_544886 [Mytilinidion resinicola]KAF2804378.1 hypothetical protein BDZ99DRAFT_544886 [Mytilinidion resinicola]